MGVYLSTPVTTKDSSYGGDDSTSTQYGVTSMQGWRCSMEDAHVTYTALTNPTLAMYGVFDGHGGSSVSIWISHHIRNIFQDMLTKYENTPEDEIRKMSRKSNLPYDYVKYAKSLEETFLQLDVLMQKESHLEELKAIQQSFNSKDKMLVSSYALPMSNTHFLYHDDNGSQYFLPTVGSSGNSNSLEADFNSLIGNTGNSYTGEDVENIISTQASNKDVEILDDDDDSHNEQHDDKRSSNEDNNSSDNQANSQQHNQHTTNAQPSGTKNENNTQDNREQNALNRVDTLTSTPKSPINKSNNNNFDDIRDILEIDDDDEYDFAEEDEYENSPDIQQDVEAQPQEKEIHDFCGATAIVVLVSSSPQPSLIIANAGDSRAVLCRKGKAIPLSYDHKPLLPVELQRIENAGGTVVGGRVDGNLNLSRSVGDLSYKSDPNLEPRYQRITAFPDITIVNLSEGDEFLVIACDGIWDCKSNQEVVDFIKSRYDSDMTPKDLTSICESLCDQCLSPSPQTNEGLGCDNMTCLIIKINTNSMFSCPSESDSIIYYNYSPFSNQF